MKRYDIRQIDIGDRVFIKLAFLGEWARVTGVDYINNIITVRFFSRQYKADDLGCGHMIDSIIDVARPHHEFKEVMKESFNLEVTA